MTMLSRDEQHAIIELTATGMSPAAIATHLALDPAAVLAWCTAAFAHCTISPSGDTQKARGPRFARPDWFSDHNLAALARSRRA